MTRQLARGVQLGGESVDEYEAARLVTEIVPSAEMVRFANTGSEAVQLAFRIARGATGRDTIVKFEGHYHGWLDSVFVGLPGPAECRARRRPAAAHLVGRPGPGRHRAHRGPALERPRRGRGAAGPG